MAVWQVKTGFFLALPTVSSALTAGEPLGVAVPFVPPADPLGSPTPLSLSAGRFAADVAIMRNAMARFTATTAVPWECLPSLHHPSGPPTAGHTASSAMFAGVDDFHAALFPEAPVDRSRQWMSPAFRPESPARVRRIRHTGGLSPVARRRLIEELLVGGQIPNRSFVRLAICNLPTGGEEAVIEFIRTAAFLTSVLGAPIPIAVALPLPSPLLGKKSIDASQAFALMEAWAEQAIVLIAEAPLGLWVLLERREQVDVAAFHQALRGYGAAIETLYKSIDRGAGKLFRRYAATDGEVAVRDIVHRINNMLVKLTALAYHLDRLIEAKDVAAAARASDALYKLLPPHDLRGVLHDVEELVRLPAGKFHKRLVTDCHLPPSTTFREHRAVHPQTALLLLDQALFELGKNAVSYAATTARIASRRLSNGDLLIEVVNDRDAPLDPREVARLGKPGVALSGINRADSTHMGLYTVFTMMRRLELPPPDIRVEHFDGCDHFVATLVIPRERLESGGEESANVSGWGAVPAPLRTGLRSVFTILRSIDRAPLAGAESAEDWVSRVGVMHALLALPYHFFGTSMNYLQLWKEYGETVLHRENLDESIAMLQALSDQFVVDPAAQEWLLMRLIQPSGDADAVCNLFAEGMEMIDAYLRRMANQPDAATYSARWAESVATVRAAYEIIKK